ncbi:Peptidase family S41 [Sphingopyxis sp. YR583]|uniref:S41 family peptidase n=1 Tax=Sphingopyxis sp. YR583 TaxID=1881047 RepID=UPI0008A73498|nr:S41 family peptidase [Sphingopyxis sp. YR583]SEH12986.1 Peptidase family S41 [Sphingopyxis sp. YR583]
MRKTLIAALLMAALTGPNFAVAAEAPAAPVVPAPPAALPPETVRSDFAYLYDTLQEAHYDLYAHRPKAEYDDYYRTLLATIEGPMDPTATAILFQKFVAYGRIGHARINAPIAAFVTHLQSGGTFLPIFIRVDGDRVTLTETADQNGVLRAGTEILAINGVPIRELLDQLSAYVSAERPYMAHAQMEESFHALLWLDRGAVSAVTVTARLADKTVRVPVDAINFEQRAALAKRFPAPQPSVDFGTREHRPLDGGLAYLRPGPFYNIETTGDGPAPSYEASSFRNFIDDSFRKIIANGATDLILDLRNNPGGDNSFSDPMVAWFADRPFRFASSFMLKASAATKADYARQRAAGTPIDADFLKQIEAEERQPNGTRYAYALPMVMPRPEPRFKGRVWVLVNRHSYSNAASVAALVQDYGFGKVIGEETADVASNYASVQHFTLPGTGIVVTYPKSHFLRPNGKDEVEGVVPHLPFATHQIATSEDSVLDAAFKIVRSGHRAQP